ncbi:tyrosine-type recombinase/integrase [Ferrimonas balearica]|uniref:tyrosine-type recombinase/integrase n=1 Tax=Ferrimonas balearica TaxID=44012 RepID=UPI001C591F5D|nr:tyrosine-type recombinase/integrase [Ferrimonas balearica]MBW3165516.1 tyrosine-type recombinase/integrase [Ferrimonas balearica]
MTDKNKYLTKRGDTYYFQRHIPQQIRHLYNGKTTFQKSLGTTCLKTARIRRDTLNGEIANQMASSYDPERIRFKAFVEELRQLSQTHPKLVDTLSADELLGVASDDAVAHAAYNHVVDGHSIQYSVTVREMLQSWLSRNAGKKNADTVSKMRHSVDLYLTWLRLPDQRLHDISKKDVVRFIEHIAAQYSASTISAHLSRLRSVWTHAYQQGEVTCKTSPFCDHDISQYRESGSTKKQLFTREQFTKIMTWAEAQPQGVRLLVNLAVYTGARLSELCNLTAGDVFTEEEVTAIRIRKGKTKSAIRIVPLVDELAAEIADIAARMHQDAPLLGLETKEAGRIFSRFKTAHITEESSRSFHSFRAHMATALQRAGVAEFTAATILGHATGRSMSYAHYARSEEMRELKKAAESAANQIKASWYFVEKSN